MMEPVLWAAQSVSLRFSSPGVIRGKIPADHICLSKYISPRNKTIFRHVVETEIIQNIFSLKRLGLADNALTDIKQKLAGVWLPLKVGNFQP